MRAQAGGALLLLCLCAGGQAQTPSSPAVTDDQSVTAEAPIVAGNLASAKQRAMTDAYRQAVDRVFARLLVDLGVSEPLRPPVQELRSTLPRRSSRFVRGYRLLQQEEVNGAVRVRMEVEVDEVLLRREIDKARGGAPTADANATLALVAGPPEAAAALATGLRAAGVALSGETVPTPILNDDAARALGGARKAGFALLAQAIPLPTAPVRATTLVGASCRWTVRLLPLPTGQPIERAVDSWGFRGTEDQARQACWEQGVAALVSQLKPMWPLNHSGSAGASSDVRLVTLSLDLNEPAALQPFLRTLRRQGSVSGAEVRRIAVGRIDVRVATRLASEGLVAILIRQEAPLLQVTAQEILPDRIRLQVRLTPAQSPLPTTP